MKKPGQYRIVKNFSKPPSYTVQVTWGLMDTDTIGHFLKQAAARAKAKAHALSHGVTNPIILT